jgi:hypothetical protein
MDYFEEFKAIAVNLQMLTVPALRAAKGKIIALRERPDLPPEIRERTERLIQHWASVWDVLGAKDEEEMWRAGDGSAPDDAVVEILPFPRNLPGPPIMAEETQRFLSCLRTEDSFREWCVYGDVGDNRRRGTRVKPIGRGKPSMNTIIAQRYRKGWPRGSSLPECRDADDAMLLDFVLRCVRERPQSNEQELLDAAAVLRPYLRRIDDVAIVPAIPAILARLMKAGLARKSRRRGWVCTPAGRRVLEKNVDSLWR